MRTTTYFFLGIILFFPVFLFAYTGHTEQKNGVTITIEQIETITALDSPFEVTISLCNDNTVPIHLSVSVISIETVVSSDESRKEVSVAAQDSTTIKFAFYCKPGTYSAQYPIRVVARGKLNNEEILFEPVQVFVTDFTATVANQEPLTPERISLPIQGGISLYSVREYAPYWNYDGQETVRLPVGWQGNDKISHATFIKRLRTFHGVSKNSFSVHPPFLGGTGNTGISYSLKLPLEKPVTLTFYGALLDFGPTEPGSDGVTYRIKVNGEAIWENLFLETDWVVAEVDLSAFAGQDVTLQLENDPGPQRNAFCDHAFWGDPILFVGKRPQVQTTEEKALRRKQNLESLKSGKPYDENTLVFLLDNNLSAVVTLGRNGFIDGIIGVGNSGYYVQYDGLSILLRGQPIGDWPSVLNWGEWIPKPGNDPKCRQFEQEVRSHEHSWMLTYTIRSNGPAIQFGVECDDPTVISLIKFGPTSHHAHRVYYGHGYCIVEPKAFQAVNGGHNFSTSHVGFDFDNGLSVLMATTAPPMEFVVNPGKKIYTLTTAPDSTMTLLPGLNGAMDCAVRYRPIYDKKAAPGVANKAGRFVFDIWGGSYKDHTRLLQKQIEYGLTDALFFVHVWQRWGYDNRLPDIWPPDAKYGTFADIKETLDLCRQHGILYALHDNYIDQYPDNSIFHYDLISFEENGTPRISWINGEAGAMSYQFRPDTIFPAIDRNMTMIMNELPVTAYYVDVFSAINIMDFYDRNGNFHSRAETLAYWNKAFDKIREYLGNDSPTFSEAGSDFLIGHLDGADCQFMMLSNEPGAWRNLAPCEKWSRVPWFDAVNHTRFSLHGVGYDSRYHAERGLPLHGYMSDDYMSTEVLTAHALMVGLPSMERDSIRKYWFLQPLIRNLADKEIMSVEFEELDIDRLKITWNDGTFIYVNQGKSDWVVDIPNHGTVELPQYGFYAWNDTKKLLATIKRNNGHVVEYSQHGKTYFINPRNNTTNRFLPIMPTADTFNDAFKITGENEFELPIQWNVFRSMEPLQNLENLPDYSWFMQLEEPWVAYHIVPYNVQIGKGEISVSVKNWDKQHVTDTGKLSVPDELNSGIYNVLVGLATSDENKHRASLLGPSPGRSIIQIGRLRVQKQGGKIFPVEFIPEAGDAPELFERLLPPKQPCSLAIDDLSGDGAFLAEFREKELLITLLPNEKISEITIDLSRYGRLKQLPEFSIQENNLLKIQPETFSKYFRIEFE